LFGVPPSDPLTYVAIAAILSTAVLLASALPALHATRIDPVVALRAE
jgi:ABC-type antimicrobial peptide transport system permease subunit